MTRIFASIIALGAFAGFCVAMAWVQRKARPERLVNVVEFPATTIDNENFHWL